MTFQNASGFSASAPDPEPEPYKWQAYKIESSNFWAGRRGYEDPPPPTYRTVNGKRVFGRYMDPWGCQAIMDWSQGKWEGIYKPAIIQLAVMGVVVEFAAIYLLVVLPIALALYWWHRRKLRNIFMHYYGPQQEMIETGEPVWVPYDKRRLWVMSRHPQAYWP